MPTAADTTNQTATRVGHRQLQAITDQLDATDRELLALLAMHRFATTRQLAEITNFDNRYISERSALRQTTRHLNRHRRLSLVDHLERRIGGVRAGSTGYIWYLTEPGHRMLRILHPPSSSDTGSMTRQRRHTSPSYTFLAHALATTETRLIIQHAIQAAGGSLTLVRTEPDCWRTWLDPGGGTRWLKPDLEVITRTAGGDEDHWLLEIDLGTENPARLIAKCHDYQTHFNTGVHQARYGYYPQVVWVMNEQRRAEWLRQHIVDDPRLMIALFEVIGSEEGLATIVQAGP